MKKKMKAQEDARKVKGSTDSQKLPADAVTRLASLPPGPLAGRSATCGIAASCLSFQYTGWPNCEQNQQHVLLRRQGHTFDQFK